MINVREHADLVQEQSSKPPLQDMESFWYEGLTEISLSPVLQYSQLAF